MTNAFNPGDMVRRNHNEFNSFWISECRIRGVDPYKEYRVSKCEELTIYLEGFGSRSWHGPRFNLSRKVVDLDMDDEECI